MAEVPVALEIQGRSFKVGDRVKCFVWRLDNPPIRKWVAGTIDSFVPKRVAYERPFNSFFRSWGFDKNPRNVIIEETEDLIVYDDYHYMRMLIRTDEKISNDPDDLFEGFGWNTSGTELNKPAVIFETEEDEPDPFTITRSSPADIIEDLPF